MSRVVLLAVLLVLSACNRGPELPSALLAGAEPIDPLCFAHPGNVFPVKDCATGFAVSQRVDNKKRRSASYKPPGTEGGGDLFYIEYSYLGSAGDDVVVLVKRRGQGSNLRASTLYLLSREEDTLTILKSAAGAPPCGNDFASAAKCLEM